MNLSFLSAVVVYLAVGFAHAESPGTDKINDSTRIIAEMSATPEQSIPQAIVEGASGIAVIPGAFEMGFLGGVLYGKGILVVRSGSRRWSNPVFVTFKGGSIGWQAGAYLGDIILVFNRLPSIDTIDSREFILSTNATIVAGPVGRQGGIGIGAGKQRVYTYARSKGLFLGTALKGAVLQVDNNANEAFYARNDITANEIIHENMKVPNFVEKFKQALVQYAMRPRP